MAMRYMIYHICMYSLLLTYIGRVMTLSCRRRYMRYSHLLGDFRHDFGPQLDLGLRPRCSASAQYHAFRLVQQKAISNTYTYGTSRQPRFDLKAWHAGVAGVLIRSVQQ